MSGPRYFEIQADDCKRAIKFYKTLFGWKFIKAKGMPIEYYRIETEDMRGGLLKRPAPVTAKHSGTNAFTCSMEVADFDKTEKKILSLGGIVALPKFAVPGVCWQGYFLDTEGNVFGIFEPNEKAQ